MEFDELNGLLLYFMVYTLKMGGLKFEVLNSYLSHKLCLCALSS